eukprot:Gb_18554 [translate_table: standard]
MFLILIWYQRRLSYYASLLLSISSPSGPLIRRKTHPFSPLSVDSVPWKLHVAMAIVKKGLRVSSNSNQSQALSSSSTDDELQLKENCLYETCSGGESDTMDDSDIAELGAKLCMVEDHKCLVLYVLFDLPHLKQILSLDAWNSCLTEEERQASEPFKKGEPGRPPGQSSKKAEATKNQGVADAVYVIAQEKSLTTTNGKGVYVTQVRPPFPQAMGGWEANGYIGETSFSQPKNRHRKQKKSSEIPESVARQQGVELSNFNARSSKIDSGYDKKRVYDQVVLNNIGGQLPVWLGRDTRHFDENNNLAGGKRFMPDHRRYVQEGAMFNKDGSCAVQRWRQIDRQIMEHHRNSVEQYKLPVEQYHNIGDYQTMNFHQWKSSFEKQMYPNNRKIDFQGLGQVHGEQNNL